MKNQKIEQVIEEAKKLLKDNLVSVLLIGTTAISEDFIEGWSDYDVCFVVKKKTKDVQEKISKLELSDEFLISIITEDQICSGGLWPFNDKFRTKCIYGKDITTNINLPSTNDSKAQLKTYIGIQENQLFSRAANFSFWSDEKVKKEAYTLIKQLLFSYSIYNWLRDGMFLKSRKDIYANGSDTIKRLVVLLHNWKDVNKKHLSEAIQQMQEVVKEVKEFCKGI